MKLDNDCEIPDKDCDEVATAIQTSGILSKEDELKEKEESIKNEKVEKVRAERLTAETTPQGQEESKDEDPGQEVRISAETLAAQKKSKKGSKKPSPAPAKKKATAPVKTPPKAAAKPTVVPKTSHKPATIPVNAPKGRIGDYEMFQTVLKEDLGDQELYKKKDLESKVFERFGVKKKIQQWTWSDNYSGERSKPPLIITDKKKLKAGTYRNPFFSKKK